MFIYELNIEHFLIKWILPLLWCSHLKGHLPHYCAMYDPTHLIWTLCVLRFAFSLSSYSLGHTTIFFSRAPQFEQGLSQLWFISLNTHHWLLFHSLCVQSLWPHLSRYTSGHPTSPPVVLNFSNYNFTPEHAGTFYNNQKILHQNKLCQYTVAFLCYISYRKNNFVLYFTWEKQWALIQPWLVSWKIYQRAIHSLEWFQPFCLGPDQVGASYYHQDKPQPLCVGSELGKRNRTKINNAQT